MYISANGPAADSPALGDAKGARGRASLSRMVEALSGAGERTRLRVLALLRRGDLSVGELAQALAQSQPRISRHLRMLTECGLVERLPEGAWVFYRLAAAGSWERQVADLSVSLLDQDDPDLARDAERFAAIRAARQEAAEAYFARNAEDWQRLRSLHLPDADIEAAMLEAAGPGPFDLHIDVGVGLGRMIELFASRARRAEGFDTSRQMLALARTQLAKAEAAHASVRHGDVYDPPFAPAVADLVTIHHVLHFLDDPGAAVQKAAALLQPGGRLVIADFAPHAMEFLRQQHQHRRLGFSDAEIAGWCQASGVGPVSSRTLWDGSDQTLAVKIWAGTRKQERQG